MYALLLAVAFGFAAFYLAWSSYARIIMWKGNELRVRRTLWRDEVHLISGASSVKRSEALGEYKITFEDGAVLRISAYMHGAKDLLARLPARAQDDQ